MSHAFPTTRYFAVGFFTAAQLEDKHRSMLARAATHPAPVPIIQTSIHSVDVTIFGRDTDKQSVDVFLSTVARTPLDSAKGSGEGSFVIEAFDSRSFPPADVSPQAAFEAYLASDDGRQAFGSATAVQLLSMSLDDSPSLWADERGTEGASAVGRTLNERAN